MTDTQGAQADGRTPAEVQERIQFIVSKFPPWKGRNTAIKNFLMIYLNKTVDIPKISDRLNKYQEYFQSFEELMDELAELDPQSEHYDIDTRFDIEGTYYKNIAESERLLAIARGETPRIVNPLNVANSSRAYAQTITTDTIKRRKPKLPEPTLPKFNGEHEHWITFKSEFQALIDSQDDISLVDKLSYLRRCLTGPAYDKIKMLPITAENYAISWKLLEQAYGDPRVIVSRHLNLLLDLPVQEKETALGLNKLVDDTRQHLAALKSLEKGVTDETMITILERKIHDVTSDEWNDIIKKGTFPSLDVMLEFLSDRAMRLLNRKNEKPSRNIINNSQGNSKNYFHGNSRRPQHQKRPYEQAFLINYERKCALCGDGVHPFFRCEKFRALTPMQRLKTITDGKMCINCLRDNHQVNDCHSQTNCWECRERHNTLVHKAIHQGISSNNSSTPQEINEKKTE